jgi:hypothetical protein
MAYRKPTPVLIDSRVKELTNSIIRVLQVKVYRTCLSCTNWDEGKEICKKFNSRPPAPIIVYACDSWNDAADDDIPF